MIFLFHVAYVSFREDVHPMWKPFKMRKAIHVSFSGNEDSEFELRVSWEGRIFVWNCSKHPWVKPDHSSLDGFLDGWEKHPGIYLNSKTTGPQTIQLNHWAIRHKEYGSNIWSRNGLKCMPYMWIMHKWIWKPCTCLRIDSVWFREETAGSKAICKMCIYIYIYIWIINIYQTFKYICNARGCQTDNSENNW